MVEFVRFTGGLGKVVESYDFIWAFTFFGYHGWDLHSMSPGEQSKMEHSKLDEYGRYYDTFNLLGKPEKRDDDPEQVWLSIRLRPTTGAESDVKNTFVVQAEVDSVGLLGTKEREIFNWLDDNEWPTYLHGQELFDWMADEDEAVLEEENRRGRD